MSYKLTYFNIAGAAEKVRLAFVLSGVEFEDERVDFAQWQAMKPNTKFGQLPLLSIDGGEPVAQSGAMLRFVGRLGNGSLYPSSPAEELRMNEIIGLCEDMENAFKPGLYMSMKPQEFGMPEDFNKTDEGKEHIKKLRETFANEKLPFYLNHLQNALGGADFFGGSSPSLADCYVLPNLARFQAGYIDHIPTTVLDGHPALLEWMARLRAVPAVAEWYAKK